MFKTGDYHCMGLLKRWFKTSERPKKVHSNWNSTLNRNLSVESVTTAGWKPVRGWKKSIQNGILHWTAISVWDLWLWLVENQWEAEKSPFKMEFYTESRPQCGICDYGWFKTSEKLKKFHSKWNSTPNRDLSVESVTTAGSKPVRGQKMSIQNGTKPWSQCGTNFQWLTPKTAGLIS